MSTYIDSVVLGLGAFPILAMLFTLPYALHQYHTYGSVSKYRTLVVYSFVLYLIIAYFFVTLPLPDRASTEGNRWQDHLSLIPFTGLWYYWVGEKLSLQSLRDFLTSTTLWQVLFNFMLTVPFGMYLRYYFKQSLRRTILFSFLLSLSFELTQLTALWGIYPGPYRMADVEDLITNTSGGAIGWQAAYVFTKILPDRDALDARCREAGRIVTGKRRFWATLFDYLCILILFLFFEGAMLELFPNFSDGGIGLWTFFCVICFLQTVATRGATLGHAVCRMILVAEDGSIATWQQLAKRYLWLWAFTELPLIIAGWLTGPQFAFLGDVIIILIFLASRAYLMTYFVNEVIRKGQRPMLHDRLSKTTYMAIEVPEQTL